MRRLFWTVLAVMLAALLLTAIPAAGTDRSGASAAVSALDEAGGRTPVLLASGRGHGDGQDFFYYKHDPRRHHHDRHFSGKHHFRPWPHSRHHPGFWHHGHDRHVDRFDYYGKHHHDRFGVTVCYRTPGVVVCVRDGQRGYRW